MPYSWNQLNDLLDSYDGAVYILDMAAFRRNVSDFLASFRNYYPNTNIGYSYKTNYLPALLVEADHLGLYAEVVSGMEYQMARLCGLPHERIIFNGPVKSKGELTEALTGGARVNADSLDELETIAGILAGHQGQNVSLGLRCNLELRWKDRPSRFGLSEANGELQRAVVLVRSMPNATLAGLHSHFSYDRSVESYRERTLKMIDIARRYFPDSRPDYLDLGGGFVGPMPPALRAQFNRPMPDFAAYAEAIATALAAEYGTGDGPELILEPGVGLVGDVLSYACRVEAVKTMPDRRLAITSGSVGQMKIVNNDINLPISVLTPATEPTKTADRPTDIVGFTCLEHDLIYRDYMGTIRKGDILLFSNVGAYSLVTSPPFIRTTPPVVTMAAESDGWTLLMRPTTVDQLLAPFIW
jgi:diaminopimelate decarboxylase